MKPVLLLVIVGVALAQGPNKPPQQQPRGPPNWTPGPPPPGSGPPPPPPPPRFNSGKGRAPSGRNEQNNQQPWWGNQNNNNQQQPQQQWPQHGQWKPPTPPPPPPPPKWAPQNKPQQPPTGGHGQWPPVQGGQWPPQQPQWPPRNPQPSPKPAPKPVPKPPTGGQQPHPPRWWRPKPIAVTEESLDQCYRKPAANCRGLPRIDCNAWLPNGVVSASRIVTDEVVLIQTAHPYASHVDLQWIIYAPCGQRLQYVVSGLNLNMPTGTGGTCDVDSVQVSVHGDLGNLGDKICGDNAGDQGTGISFGNSLAIRFNAGDNSGNAPLTGVAIQVRRLTKATFEADWPQLT